MASEDRLFCMTLIVVHCNDFESYIGGNIQSSCSIIGFDKSVYHSYINYVSVLQSNSDPLHILPISSIDTNAASSDCEYHIGNMKFGEDFEMQAEEVEMNVKTEKGVGSEEEECLDKKDEEGIYSEEEQDEYIDIKEEEDVCIKEEVSLEGTKK